MQILCRVDIFRPPKVGLYELTHKGLSSTMQAPITKSVANVHSINAAHKRNGYAGITPYTFRADMDSIIPMSVVDVGSALDKAQTVIIHAYGSFDAGETSQRLELAFGQAPSCLCRACGRVFTKCKALQHHAPQQVHACACCCRVCH